MPIYKARHDHTKVWRPNGMRYSTGKARTVEQAIVRAQFAWQAEFSNALPKPEHTVYEIIGGTDVFHATLLELKEPT